MLLLPKCVCTVASKIWERKDYLEITLLFYTVFTLCQWIQPEYKYYDC